MSATTALAFGLAFAATAFVRLVRPVPLLRHLQLAAALAAALFGLATWHAVADSRWLVGAIFFLGAGLPGWLAGRRRGLSVAAFVVGLIGVALYGMAMANPMVRVAG